MRMAPHRRVPRPTQEISVIPEEPLPPDHGKICDTKSMYRTKPDELGHTSWTTEVPDVQKVAETEETAKFAVLVRYDRCYDGRREFTINSIVVQSLLLKKILGDVLQGYPGIVTDVRRLEFSTPWHPFVHRWNRLTEVKEMLEAQAEEASDDSDAREKRDVMLLLYNLLRDELRETINTFADLTRQSIVSYRLLWALFEPGCIVFSGDRVYKVVQTGETVDGLTVACQYIDWNGQKFGYVQHSALILGFHGICPISQLPIYPLRYHEDEDGVRQRLLARAAKLQSLCGFNYKHYDGVGEVQGPCGWVKVTVNSRIVLDTVSWNDFNPNSVVSVNPLEPRKILDTNSSDLSDLDKKPPPQARSQLVNGHTAANELTEDQMLITTSTLRGYSCKDKRWMRFEVDNVDDIAWDERAFDSLVMPENQKELVRAVAESQARHSKIFDDIITGKGQGMILLLIGPPGVGKTLTAESVAEIMKVPLYYMSSVDLGSTAAGVETALSKIFKMVTKWKAVLLLDEADVFLQKRSDHDLERNRLVSVMLRTLEYYEGLLMLTTNRGGSIDDAFQSRIHLRLNYADLTEESRHIIWKNFLGTSKYDHQVNESDLKDLAAKDLNGRQIKNLLKTAMLLAARKGETLKRSHIEFVLSIDPQA